MFSLADILFIICMIFAFRWRVHSTVKLTANQWNRVKAFFLQYVPQFFHNNCLLPVFVPLNGNVLTKLEEPQQEKEELKRPAPAAAAAVGLSSLPQYSALAFALKMVEAKTEGLKKELPALETSFSQLGLGIFQ